ncbi:DUF1801 domain-containing protein [Flavobacterium sp. SM2513]|uniref:DUF1801 domain-containing protein n=1 Tax=Flavobacterium sp. SM2513 TaxID=3424766 RepID=UPI003D7F6B12
MQSNVLHPKEYIESLPEDRKNPVRKLQEIILENLPEGFQEHMGYGMLCYSVPHSIYPAGYHCDPKLPLPFISLASQKNSINLYHMGIYADEKLLQWFQNEYPNHCKTKLDMGKSCIRFKKVDQIPYELVAELCRKISVKQWIETYEANYKR